MKYVTIFCGSSNHCSETDISAADRLVTMIVEAGYGIVYGGGNTGLMGVVANVAIALGGKIIGVITPEVRRLGVAHEKLSSLIEEESYSLRKSKMFELGSAYIALPGGVGTLDEFTEAAINNQFASYENTSENPVKPCCLFNVDGFYNPFYEQLKICVARGYFPQKHLDLIRLESSPERLVEYIVGFKNPEPDATKWWEKDGVNHTIWSQPAPSSRVVSQDPATDQKQHEHYRGV